MVSYNAVKSVFDKVNVVLILIVVEDGLVPISLSQVSSLRTQS